MKIQIPFFNLLIAATVLICSCEDSGSETHSKYIFPENERDWAIAEPEKYNFDSEKLEEITKYVETTKLTCMMVIAGGEQIYKYGSNSTISYIASCRKSVLAMLYGKYVENGTVNLYTTVGQMIEEYGMKDDVQGLLESEKLATINDLITSRSGIYHPASNGGDTSDKPERGTMQRGEYYLYNNWDFNFAGAVLERLVKGSYSGKEIYSIMQSDLAHPIGMCDWDLNQQKYGGTWKGSSAISYYPAYHIYLSTRDMARIGYLMLRKGEWNGKQVISRKWVEKITTPYSTFDEVNPSGEGQFSYGYMWWIFDYEYYKTNPAYEGVYMARGSGGQYLLVMPKLDLVVAWKTSTSGGKSTSPSQFFKAVKLLLEAYTGDVNITGSDEDIEFDDEIDY